MTTIRQLVKVALATSTALLLSLIAAPGASAMLAPPDPAGGTSGSGATTIIAPASGGIGAWQALAISAACVLVAGLVTLAVSGLVRTHARHSRVASA